MNGSHSDIKYFRTLPYSMYSINIYCLLRLTIKFSSFFKAPSQPRNLVSKALKHDELFVSWESPLKPNGIVTHYIVTVTKNELLLTHLDYCKTSRFSHNQIECFN